MVTLTLVGRTFAGRSTTGSLLLLAGGDFEEFEENGSALDSLGIDIRGILNGGL